MCMCSQHPYLCCVYKLSEINTLIALIITVENSSIEDTEVSTHVCLSN